VIFEAQLLRPPVLRFEPPALDAGSADRSDGAWVVDRIVQCRCDRAGTDERPLIAGRSIAIQMHGNSLPWFHPDLLAGLDFSERDGLSVGAVRCRE